MVILLMMRRQKVAIVMRGGVGWDDSSLNTARASLKLHKLAQEMVIRVRHYSSASDPSPCVVESRSTE